MNPIFNTKNMFYDYFPHLPSVRMKNDFGLGYYEQFVIREKVQKDIRTEYDRLVGSHNLVHANVYGEIGDEFDEKFYKELKTNLNRHFHEATTWGFLDGFIQQTVIEDEDKSSSFNTRLIVTLGYGLRRDIQGRVNLKEAFIALFNHDLDVLNGRELLYLTKIK